MKKLNLTIIGAKKLNKSQQKLIVGGADGPCKVHWKGNGFDYWEAHISVSEAQSEFQNNPQIVGYCCASCNSQ